MNDANTTQVEPEKDVATIARPVIPAEKIFGSAREVEIVFDGATYILRITRKNRLILQK